MKTRLRNLTPHPVVLHCDRSWFGAADAVYTIEPEGLIPRVAEQVVHTSPLGRDLGEDGWFSPGSDAAWGTFDDFVQGCPDGYLPLVLLALGEVTDLPDPEDGVILIVSRVVAQALPSRRDLWFPHDMVRDEQGRITGARALGRIKS